jgi:signal transduction histidine kinase/DNA-binding response OmpR family regulator
MHLSEQARPASAPGFDRDAPLLASTPASRRARRRAMALLTVSTLVCLAVLPFAKTPLPAVPAFISAYEAALLISDLVTAVMLYGQFRMLRQPALGVLAAGYLFAALMAAVHALSFPGLFSPSGALGAGPQTTAWLYMFWHAGFPLCVLAYTALSHRRAPVGAEAPAPGAPRGRARGALLGPAIVVFVVAGLTALSSLGEHWLPPIMVGNHYSAAMAVTVGSVWACAVLALAGLWWWPPRRSVLDLWLMVVMGAWIADIALSAVFNAGRYDLGFYAGRIYGLLAGTYVLVELLGEHARLYARLVDMHRRDHEQALALAAARDDAQAADRAKGQFLATMSHEIRTPMNAIIGLTHLALDTELTPRQHNYLAKVHGSSKALMRLLDDILDYSKIEAGRMTLEHEEFSPEEVLESVGSLFAARADEAGLGLYLQIAPSVPSFLVGDALRLGQVLANLVGNAIKFTSRGEVTVSMSASPSPSGAGQVMLHIEVRDTGIGVTGEQARHLFQPFSQAESTTSRRYGGTGLGLAICRRLVELMGGSIRVDSVPERGSVFTVSARLDLAADQRRRLDPRLVQRMRTLVVDPHDTSAQIVLQVLQSWGFAASRVADADAALAQLRSADLSGAPFDLVLLDEGTPGLADDHGLAIKLRREGQQDARHRLALVLVVSMSSHDRLLHLSRLAPADVVLTKPLTPSRLFDAVVLLQSRSARPAAAQTGRRVNLAEATRAIHGARVLLVEDNAVNQQVAGEFLSKSGMKVTLASDGLEAVDRIKAERFDLVLMDVQMPVMDGLQATRLIRSLPQGRGLPIVAMTASALAQDRQDCLAAGMDGHVAKPIDPQELVSTLLAHIPAGSRPLPDAGALPAGDDAADIARCLPAFDIRQALARVAGDVPLYREVLKVFAQHHRDDVERMDDWLDHGDWRSLAQAAHGLAGSASMLGISRVSGAAERLVGLARQAPDGATAERQALARVLRAELLAAVAAIDAFAGKTPLASAVDAVD